MKDKTNSLQYWLDKLATLQPTKNDDIKLDNIRQVAQKLGLLPFPPYVVTVAGTNGKGSTVALLEAILIGAGYSVGAYYSPHLFRYNERFHVNGEEPSDFELCQAFKVIDTYHANIALTTFEFTTLVALWLFQKASLDVCVLEVGMGGRLDAVNIIDADIAVITSIALDHCEQLGPDRKSIAIEKAGIIRDDGVLVCGDPEPPEELLNFALKKRVNVSCLSRTFFYEVAKDHWSWWSVDNKMDNLPLPKVCIKNAATVLSVVSHLKHVMPIEKDIICTTLKNVSLPARVQVVEGEVIKIFDVSHNPHAAEFLASQLMQLPFAKKTFAVFSMLSGKDVVGTAKCLKPIVDKWFVAGLNTPRGAPCSEIIDALTELGITNISEFANIQSAYNCALAEATPGDRVLVFGSFYTVAEVINGLV